MKLKRQVPVIFVLALLMVGCAKNNTVNLQTPAQRVSVYNGILAESNKAVTSGAITLQKSGVLTVSQTSQFLDYTEKVAIASKAVATLQLSPGDWVTVSTQIKVIFSAVSPPSNFATWLNGTQGKSLLDSMTSIQSTIQSILLEASK